MASVWEAVTLHHARWSTDENGWPPFAEWNDFETTHASVVSIQRVWGKTKIERHPRGLRLGHSICHWWMPRKSSCCSTLRTRIEKGNVANPLHSRCVESLGDPDAAFERPVKQNVAMRYNLGIENTYTKSDGTARLRASH